MSNLQIQTRPDQTIPQRRQFHPALFDRVVSRLVTSEGLDADVAVRAVGEAWGFLALCARTGVSEEGPLAPAQLPDVAWHATILFTRGYRELCAALGVHGIIDHEPYDDPGSHGGGGAEGTVRAFQAAGMAFDPEMWGNTGTAICDRPRCGPRPDGSCATGVCGGVYQPRDSH